MEEFEQKVKRQFVLKFCKKNEKNLSQEDNIRVFICIHVRSSVNLPNRELFAISEETRLSSQAQPSQKKRIFRQVTFPFVAGYYNLAKASLLF